jgi:hypothetical protein
MQKWYQIQIITMTLWINIEAKGKCAKFRFFVTCATDFNDLSCGIIPCDDSLIFVYKQTHPCNFNDQCVHMIHVYFGFGIVFG